MADQSDRLFWVLNDGSGQIEQMAGGHALAVTDSSLGRCLEWRVFEAQADYFRRDKASFGERADRHSDAKATTESPILLLILPWPPAAITMYCLPRHS